jgi:predicted sulfurtransferase
MYALSRGPTAAAAPACLDDMPHFSRNTMQPSNAFVNIAAYKFVSFDDTAEKRPEFLAKCDALVAERHDPAQSGRHQPVPGRQPRGNIDQFLNWLRADARFSDLEVKESCPTISRSTRCWSS